MIFKNHPPLFCTWLFGFMLSVPGFAQKAKPAYEIAIQMVKQGKQADFFDRQAKLINLSKKQAGVSEHREFRPFDALPAPNQRMVVVRMAKYANLEVVGNSSKKILPRLIRLTQTMDLKTYVFVMLVAGNKFKLKKLANRKGQVLEIAVRRIKKGQEKAFMQHRDAFVHFLNKQKEVVSNWEFAAVGGRNWERLVVSISVYKNKDAWMKITQQIRSTPLANQYLATFDVVTTQYAINAAKN